MLNYLLNLAKLLLILLIIIFATPNCICEPCLSITTNISGCAADPLCALMVCSSFSSCCDTGWHFYCTLSARQLRNNQKCNTSYSLLPTTFLTTNEPSIAPAVKSNVSTIKCGETRSGNRSSYEEIEFLYTATMGYKLVYLE
eukprot:377105_1